MIAFSCAHCAMKFQVKEEFAGRSTHCPTCKQPLTVPPAATLALPPPSRLDGPLSSLARAGLGCDVTLAGPPPANHDAAARPVAVVLAGQPANGQRYLLAGEIARGGMGAVLRAVDCDIRREVAVKYLLDQGDPRKKVRFVEEAQITGQLEHPNIVPIHELGVDARHHLFFSMKMVRGRTLQQVLRELREAPRVAEKEYPLGRLLTVYVNVCNALAYAHARGVVHRDLKPANIMLGDFGEVYVMDWGLAKVLHRATPAVPRAEAVIQANDGVAWAEGGQASAANGVTVQTSRQESDDRTMDGTILGTPQYMPPEQAVGNLAAIDQRTDVYALGAVLYEILTLQPAIDKQGGAGAILRRVVQGEVVAPQKRTPGRWVPAELSAVALKALAKEPGDRFPSVETLRRDVERYQEGRSVSAREDSKWDMVRKFVQRNKGFSAGMAATFLVLVVSLWFIGQAWLRAEQARRKAEDNYAAYEREQKEKQATAAKAVPALVQAARLVAQDRRLDDALAQLDLAQGYDRDHAPIELVRGQVLIGKFQFAPAAEALRRYMKKQPGDADARELARLLIQARVEDGGRLLALAEVLVRQKALGSASCLFEAVGKLGQKREKLLPVLRKRIEATWPGLGNRLRVAKDGSLRLDVSGCRQVGDLAPLRGMPLTSLGLDDCRQARDLSPLKGMPLISLSLYNCGVRDLSPLKGMPLTWLSLHTCSQVRDLTPLKGMLLKSLSVHACGVRDLTPLKGMPLTSIELPPQVDRGMTVLRWIKTLAKINNGAADQFWKKYDAGEFKQYKP